MNRSTITFNGDGYAQAAVPNQSVFTVSRWMKLDALDTTNENDYRNLVTTANGSLLVPQRERPHDVPHARGDRRMWKRGNALVGEWTHVTAVYDGNSRMLYVNGMEVASRQVDGGEADWGDWIRLSGSGGNAYALNGSVNGVRAYRLALNATTVDTAFRSRE